MDSTVNSDGAQQGLGPATRTRHDENFPVASRLIPARLRPHVHAFYACVRAADDVADDPRRTPEDKIALLTAMDEALQGLRGRDDITAFALDHRESALATGVPVDHARHVLQAFMLDARKRRYRNWSELINYCLYSAAPVGRYLTDLHGEGSAARPATDALCNALQILNHLQDCKDDYRALDRVYIPEDFLRAEGIGVEALAEPRCSPALRAVLNRVLDRTDELIVRARLGPARIADRGLRLETAVIVCIAERLSRKLRRRDPLAGRVALGRGQHLAAALRGVWRGLTAR